MKTITPHQLHLSLLTPWRYNLAWTSSAQRYSDLKIEDD